MLSCIMSQALNVHPASSYTLRFAYPCLFSLDRYGISYGYDSVTTLLLRLPVLNSIIHPTIVQGVYMMCTWCVYSSTQLPQ
jgi:uncharacterized protein involved in cysteine biosynthesis